MFGIWQMVLWLIWLIHDYFDPQKNEVSNLFIIIIKSEYSKYPICSFFLESYTARTFL